MQMGVIISKDMKSTNKTDHTIPTATPKPAMRTVKFKMNEDPIGEGDEQIMPEEKIRLQMEGSKDERMLDSNNLCTVETAQRQGPQPNNMIQEHTQTEDKRSSHTGNDEFSDDPEDEPQDKDDGQCQHLQATFLFHGFYKQNHNMWITVKTGRKL